MYLLYIFLVLCSQCMSLPGALCYLHICKHSLDAGIFRAAWIAYRNTPGQDISCNNTACSYYNIVSNNYSRTDYCVATNPNIITYRYCFSIFISRIACAWIYGMTCGINLKNTGSARLPKLHVLLNDLYTPIFQGFHFPSILMPVPLHSL